MDTADRTGPIRSDPTGPNHSDLTRPFQGVLVFCAFVYTTIMNQSTYYNELNLFHRDGGIGNARVFVPGLGATHEMFGPQVDAFQDRYRVIRPDLRGNGRSGRLVGPIGTILNRQCDDITALLDQLGVGRAVPNLGWRLCVIRSTRPTFANWRYSTDSWRDTSLRSDGDHALPVFTVPRSNPSPHHPGQHEQGGAHDVKPYSHRQTARMDSQVEPAGRVRPDDKWDHRLVQRRFGNACRPLTHHQEPGFWFRCNSWPGSI